MLGDAEGPGRLTEESAKTFTGNKAANGAEGYAMQYNALKAILDKFM